VITGSVTGAVYIDLTRIKPEAAHRRVAQLSSAKDGAQVFLVVGPLALNPRVVNLVHEQITRLNVQVWGEAYAVARWVAALRGADMVTGDIP
jgi:hypothetical protein